METVARVADRQRSVRELDEREMAAWTAFLEASHRVFRSVEQQLKQEAGLSHAGTRSWSSSRRRATPGCG
ncbi:hypothetical protein [Streptomyces sp. NBC_01803]|uniref:hypothetical protein n=1 Tax=Streptomyces sp. NBC_01803 TaxID=2975946 RepID=UPI002DDBADB7|nr:hypothetical protein [Streptomyces sp. NBC_01803]WSA46913.1 hypothetical protein OIE51_23690 [Streptomyces sp. NBC_01803]